MELNFEHLHLFIEGMKISREAHAEESKSYEYGLNGRLYSYNGKLAYSSIKGTLEIYNDPNIIKYLGFYAFPDELIVFVKYNGTNLGAQTITNTTILGQNIVVNIPYGSTQHAFTNELLTGATENFNTIIENIPNTPVTNLIDTYAPPSVDVTIDLQDYYLLSGANVPYEICDISNINNYEYNDQYQDAIIVFRNNGYHAFTSRIAWLGNMNWDINRKITTVGIDENMYYKRVYFTDNLNPLRVFNLKDNELEFRDAEEFAIKQNSIMLQPVIKEIKDGGAIKAMTVQYAYKLITENGQATKFSPYSEPIYIVRDSDGFDFEGGDIDETTSKQVVIQIPILNQNYKEIQAIAIEFAADTIPTAIRNLGIKPIAALVEFTHNGNESEFSQNFTLEDITETGNIWTYCNDITAKNNKLIAAGLRNEPYALAEKYVQDLFLFKGFKSDLTTHDYLINQDPTQFRFIDPLNTEDTIYLKKQLYNRFLFFGNVTLTLRNKSGASESISFVSSSDQYIDYIEEVWVWLKALQDNGTIAVSYPNLIITRSNLSILFSSSDGLTDLFDYYFETSISQAIIDFDNEYGFLTVTVDANNLVYGAQSVGFNQGTGVRMTFREVKEPVLNKSPELYQSGPILDLETPTLGKTFVKGEIYRMSIQFFSKGDPLFAIVLGDIYTPTSQDGIREILNDGSLNIQTTPTYVNQSVLGNTLYAHRLEARIEVRVPCLFKQEIDSYQIQYVERTENNRTILCQGIAAPLIRLIDWQDHPSEAGIDKAPNVYSKWTLPFNGGPLYTVYQGFNAYDDAGKGENYNTEVENLYSRANEREITNRRMFYFDSPDLIQERVSSSLVKNGNAQVIARVNTDATTKYVRSSVPQATFENGEAFHDYRLKMGPDNQTLQALSFSRKIGIKQLSGDDKEKPYVVNVSVFSELTIRNDEVAIEHASDLLTKGEIIASAVLGTSFEASNMALSLFGQGAYNSGIWRSGHRVGQNAGSKDRYSSQTSDSSQESHGYPTVFIRTEADIFTNDFIGPQATTNPIISPPTTFYGNYVNRSEDGAPNPSNSFYWKDGVESSDSHAIINIKMNNEASIYGGRTKYAYSQNQFIPLGKVIPIKGSEGTNKAQVFYVQGDFFVTLFLRTKNDYSALLIQPGNNDEGYWDLRQDPWAYESKHDYGYGDDYSRGAAWAYAVILETEVESRLSSDQKFYKQSNSIDFGFDVYEALNPAYFKKNNLRIYSPVPYNFKDDPLQVATLSASKTKLNGDYFDAWTEFLLNEFYELEKNKGIITNVTNWKDSIFAIQEQESSEVFIDESDFITTDSGENVAIKKGDGRTFTNHKKLSDFGTSIRRALCEGELGFCFFDEHNRAFIKFGESLSLQAELQTKLHELFEYDKIIDTEGYYDVKYKETNIRLRTESGKAYLLSYNELLGKFNGWYTYDHDIYMTFDKRVFVPCCANVQILINCPQIFSDDNFSVQIGEYFEYQIQATEEPIAFNATNLPPGVNINTLTGLIYGVISTPGVYVITIFAENEDCFDTLEITVTANIDQLYGTIIGIAIVTGFLSGKVQIEGVSDGIAIVTGTLTWAHSQITAETDGIAIVTGVLSYRVKIYGHVEGLATVTPDLWTFNLFFGQVDEFFPNQNSFAPMMDMPGSGGGSIAYWSEGGGGFKAWISNHYHGADYHYQNEIQTWVVTPKPAFYVDSFYSNNNNTPPGPRPRPTWIIDVQGKITRINQGLLSSILYGLNITRCQWIYFPGMIDLSSSGGYFTLNNLSQLRGYITFPEWTQDRVWARSNYYNTPFGESNYQHMNYPLVNAYNVDVLHLPKLKRINLQYSNRYTFYNMTNVRRVYMPLVESMLSSCKLDINGSYDPLIDPVRDRRIFGGTSANPVNGVPTIFYIHPSLATSRKSDAMIRVSRTVPVLPGETVTINGLAYEAVSGVKQNNTQFRCDSPGIYGFKQTLIDLRNSVNDDTRVGTLGKCYLDQEFLPDGGPAYGLIKSYDADPIYDAITISTTATGIYLSTPTLLYGGTLDRNVRSWVISGAEIRYVDNFEPPPYEVTDLSVSDITATSAVLNFTPPVGSLNGVDFYEVWIYDGTALKDLFVPRMEITGSGAIITGLNKGRIQTVKIVTRDTLYNCLEDINNPGTPIFSNEIKFYTPGGGLSEGSSTVTGTMYRKNTASGNAILEGSIGALGYIPGFVSVWKLDNNANDSIGSYNGTEHNITYEAGKLEQAARFNGINSYIDCGNAIGLALTGEFSILAWVYLNSYNVANSGCTICTWVSPGYTTYPFHYVFQSNGILRLNSNNEPIDTLSVIPLETWTHVAVARKATGEVRHYINGVFNNIGNQTIPSGPVSGEGIFTIGRKDGQWFDGLIDDLGISNRYLTPIEIEYAFNTGNNNISLSSTSTTNGTLTDAVDMQGIATVEGNLSAKGELGGTIDGQTTIIL